MARRLQPGPRPSRAAFGDLHVVAGEHLKLHVGCGDIRIPGFVNVDIDPALSAVDVVDDAATLGRFAGGTAALIYACHVLEHFPHDEVPRVLRRWHTVLEAGGELRVSVPDIDRIVTIYQRNWDHFHTPPHAPWIGLIYGGQLDAHDFHKTGFNFVWMKHLLEDSGFVDVEEYPHAPHWLGVRDASLASEPFREFISLNVRATKPRSPG
jgi:predicted SAM-dependent methyltransferase